MGFHFRCSDDSDSEEEEDEPFDLPTMDDIRYILGLNEGHPTEVMANWDDNETILSWEIQAPIIKIVELSSDEEVDTEEESFEDEDSEEDDYDSDPDYDSKD